MTLTAPRRAGKRRSKGGHVVPLSARVLDWYDRNRRDLPWRARPGERADPYRVWLSEIMLQQTTVNAVAPYYARFLERFPDVRALASAPLEVVLGAWAGLGYYARARNLHACAQAVVERHGGAFPAEETGLRELPGIGAYTAAAIAAIAFGRKATPVDGNIERVVARLFAVSEALPSGKPLIRRHAEALTPDARAGDFAQAMMDIGATVCTPKNPACVVCPLRLMCAASQRGAPEAFPVKTAKASGKTRHGAAFVVLRGDDVLVRSRPARGLLGGMTEPPMTPFTTDFDVGTALDHAPSLPGRARLHWRKVDEPVIHVFTHFRLELSVFVARTPARSRPPEGMQFIGNGEIGAAALPTLMRKAVAVGLRAADASRRTSDPV